MEKGAGDTHSLLGCSFMTLRAGPALESLVMGRGEHRGGRDDLSQEGGCKEALVKRPEEGVLTVLCMLACVGNDFPLALAWTWLIIIWKAELY